MISEQAVDYGLNKRFEQQIALKESALAALLGPTVIVDVAIIGSDTFLREGAAMGILFQWRNNTALALDIQQQRSEALKAQPKGKEEKLTIAGKQVSLISTPDSRLRSFYVADGDFHFVSTSRALVERFLETAPSKDQKTGKGAFGASVEFRYARQIMPAERDDTVFVYLSRAFFRNLMGPQYQIEMKRRLRSATEMEMIELAREMARAEGHPADTIEKLIEADVLPSWFGQRIDGSKIELVDGEMFDSVRGARGSFLPIPDVPLEKITRSEATTYSQFLETAAGWGEPDPLIAGLRKTSSRQRNGTRGHRLASCSLVAAQL